MRLKETMKDLVGVLFFVFGGLKLSGLLRTRFESAIFVKSIQRTLKLLYQPNERVVWTGCL